MRIELQPPAGKSILLGDDLQRHYIDKYLPSPEWKIQIREGVRAEHVSISPRYNVRWTVSFEVDRAYNSEAEALAAITDFPLSIPLQGALRVTQGTRTRYFLNAAKSFVRPLRHNGCSVRFALSFAAEQCANSKS